MSIELKLSITCVCYYFSVTVPYIAEKGK